MEKRISIPLQSLLAPLSKSSFQFHGDSQQVIDLITWDFQKVIEKSMYLCFEDEEFQENHIKANSLAHWKEAVRAGAVCLVAGRNKISNLPDGINLLEVDNVNIAAAAIAKVFYDDPLLNMKVIGITGTNGKTTTSQLIDSILLKIGNKTGVIGTIGVFYPSGVQSASHLSNPMVTELFEIGKRMREEDVRFLTMEVTSHAMAFDRNDSIDFDVAVFTNLTQDHLDYHKTFESYKKCKLKHFQQLGTGDKRGYGVVNVDDISGKEFVDALDKQLIRSGRAEVITYGIRNKDADLVAYPRQMTGSYCEFDVFLKGNHLSKVNLPMPGLFNIYNCLAAFSATFVLGISIEDIVNGLESVRGVDGRFERVSCQADFDVYIDYAHTPDSLDKILREIRGITRKRIIVVFGCGGDRDRSKRAQMGEIAAGLADVCVITSDNPRSESPKAIIDDIVGKIPSDSDTQMIIEEDRRQAIYLALEMASSEDSVLIAGKGHEGYQIIGKTRHKLLDRKVVEDYFQFPRKDFTRACIEIDLSRLRNNLRLIFDDKPEHVNVLAVVKDDGLGHGMIETAREAIKAGCRYLGASCLSEALKLRNKFEDVPILLFGERLDNQIPVCVRQNLTIQIQSKEKAEVIGRIAMESGKVIRVHLKVDTGMGRYGVRWDQAVDEYKSILGISGIHVEGIMTHFAQSDEADKSYADKQWSRFQDVLTSLEQEKKLPPLIHACNSGGYLDLPHAHGNMVRIGILPCGVYPSKVCRQINIDGQQLMPVMKVLARVSFLKDLQPDDLVGYGMHFKAEKKMIIAVLPFGYGDGYPRLRNRGFVLVRGQEAPIVGGNGMDATMVDVTEIEGIQVGDEVILLGSQLDKEITAMMIADWAETVTYDILSHWSRRMDRFHINE